MSHEEHGLDACCGACAYAMEVEREGGPAPSSAPYFRFTMNEQGAPEGVVLALHGAPPSVPQRIRVEKSEVIIGRSPPADVCIPSDVLSRKQCRLIFQDGHVAVEDMQSSCGTYVNGLKVTRAWLREGDTLWIANITIQLEHANTERIAHR